VISGVGELLGGYGVVVEGVEPRGSHIKDAGRCQVPGSRSGATLRVTNPSSMTARMAPDVIGPRLPNARRTTSTQRRSPLPRGFDCRLGRVQGPSAVAR
jgi:hypothetical protein